MYVVTRQFVSGLLKGLVVTETTSVKFEVGRVYKPCAGGSAYRIEACYPIS